MHSVWFRIRREDIPSVDSSLYRWLRLNHGELQQPPPPSTPCCPTAFLALTWDDIELPQLTTVGCAGREKGGSGRAGSGPAVCSPDEEEPCRRDPGRTSLTARLCLRLSDSVGVGVVCYVVPRCCGRGRVLNSRHRGKCCVKRQL